MRIRRREGGFVESGLAEVVDDWRGLSYIYI